jgi:hypothetical protein
LVLLTSCAGRSPDSDHAEQVAAPIVNGTRVTNDVVGTALIQYTPITLQKASCSASGIAGGGWLLTAAHCVNGFTPSQIKVNRVANLVTNIFVHPSLDVALLQLNVGGVSAPLAITDEPESGGVLYCQGYGAAHDVVQSAVVPMINGQIPGFDVGPNAQGQIPEHGDSGGGCYRRSNGIYQLVAIVQGGYPITGTPTEAQLIPVGMFRDWAEALAGTTPVLFRQPNFLTPSEELLPGGPNAGGYPALNFNLVDAVESWVVPSLFTAQLNSNSVRAPIVTGQGVEENLDPTLARLVDSASVLTGGVTVWPQLNGAGNAQTYSSGGSFGTFGAVGSVFVPAGWRVRLSNSAQTTDVLTLTEGMHYSVRPPFDNTRGTFELFQILEPAMLYSNPGYNSTPGFSYELLPGCYDFAYQNVGIPVDTVSSAFVPEFQTIAFFPNASFVGPISFLSASGNLPSGIDNHVRSLCILEQPFTCGVMMPGQALMQGQSLSSCDGRFSLVLQGDGNLVLYETPASPGTVLWTTGTQGNGGTVVYMQNDGNFVFYDANWHAMFPNCFFGAAEGPTSARAGCLPSYTNGNANAYLTLGNDGNLAVHSDSGAILWQSNTGNH